MFGVCFPWAHGLMVTDVSFLMCTLSEYMRRIALIEFRTFFHLCKTKLPCFWRGHRQSPLEGNFDCFSWCLGCLGCFSSSPCPLAGSCHDWIQRRIDALCRLSTSHSCGDADDKRHDVPLVKSLRKAESLSRSPFQCWAEAMETPMSRQLAALRCLTQVKMPAWSENYEGKKPSYQHLCSTACNTCRFGILSEECKCKNWH